MTKIINFFAIALALYFIAHVYSNLTHDSIITKTAKCGYCRKAISLTVSVIINTRYLNSNHVPIIQAKRCPFCTSWLDGREDGSGPT
jgi:large conductance mechanosensitive channel